MYVSREGSSESGLARAFTADVISTNILFTCPYFGICGTVKPVLSSQSKEDKKLVFKTDYPLLQVKSMAEGSKGIKLTSV